MTAACGGHDGGDGSVSDVGQLICSRDGTCPGVPMDYSYEMDSGGDETLPPTSGHTIASQVHASPGSPLHLQSFQGCESLPSFEGLRTSHGLPVAHGSQTVHELQIVHGPQLLESPHQLEGSTGLISPSNLQDPRSFQRSPMHNSRESFQIPTSCQDPQSRPQSFPGAQPTNSLPGFQGLQAAHPSVPSFQGPHQVTTVQRYHNPQPYQAFSPQYTPAPQHYQYNAHPMSPAAPPQPPTLSYQAPPCFETQPWDYKYCYGGDGMEACRYNAVIDIEDFM